MSTRYNLRRTLRPSPQARAHNSQLSHRMTRGFQPHRVKIILTNSAASEEIKEADMEGESPRKRNSRESERASRKTRSHSPAERRAKKIRIRIVGQYSPEARAEAQRQAVRTRGPRIRVGGPYTGEASMQTQAQGLSEPQVTQAPRLEPTLHGSMWVMQVIVQQQEVFARAVPQYRVFHNRNGNIDAIVERATGQFVYHPATDTRVIIPAFWCAFGIRCYGLLDTRTHRWVWREPAYARLIDRYLASI